MKGVIVCEKMMWWSGDKKDFAIKERKRVQRWDIEERSKFDNVKVREDGR